ncbi:MAG: flagellar basal body P-ring formation chaperone FlgA [Burkholderiales bacterium]
MRARYITKPPAFSRKLLHACLASLVIFPTGTLAHAQWQELAAVQRIAESFVREQLSGVPGRIQIETATPEARLRLPACAQLQAFAPPGTRFWGNASVGIRCESPSAWSVYLPVTVRIFDYAVVSTRPIQRGQTVTQTDVALQESDLTLLPANVFVRLDQVTGKTAKASIAGGMALRAQWLSAPQVIALGDTVNLNFAGSGFDIQSTGRALGSGGLGETVEVKAASGRILKGIVRARGLVWVQ